MSGLGGIVGRVVRGEGRQIAEEGAERGVRSGVPDAVPGSATRGAGTATRGASDPAASAADDLLGGGTATRRPTDLPSTHPQGGGIPATGAPTRTFNPAAADFGPAARVIPSTDVETASRFSVPVPRSDAGQPLVNPTHYPADLGPPLGGTPYPNGGQPMTTWDGKPITAPDGGQARGQVFFNYTDQKWQGVQSTGDQVMLFNRATPQQREQLRTFIDGMGGPSALTPERIPELTRYARSIGVGDVYNSDMPYVRSRLSPVAGQTTHVEGYGTFTRQNETVQAGTVTGPGFIPGLNVRLEAGQTAVLIRTPAGEVRHVEADAFAATYRNRDGTPADIRSLPVLQFNGQ